MANDIYQSLPILHLSDIIKKQHNKKRLQCLMFGNFGACNLGDEAILSGELAELAKIPNLKATVVAKFPEEVRRHHNTKAISFYAFNTLRREMKKADFVIIGGGGLFNKAEPALLGLGYQLYLLSLFLWAQRVFKKKIYIIGIGIYGNTNFFIRQLAISLMKQAKIVTVRDQHSLDVIRQHKALAHFYKDNSFLMDLLPSTKVLQDPYFMRFYKKDRINIGLSLIKPASKKTEKHLLTEMVTFIAKNHEKADFWFYASDYHPSYFNDEKFGHVLHELIKQKVGNDVQFHFVPTSWSPQMFFSSIRLMDSMISMRLHTTIFSYRLKSNFVGISYDKKCASFITSIGKEPLATQDVTWRKLQTRITQA
jgi:polysaccharide pyruvyl transferase WcaK-like protein